MGSDLRVEDIMSQPVIVVHTGKTVKDAAKIMKDHEVGSVIVVEGEKVHKAKGIITERDIIRKVVSEDKNAGDIKVEEVMSKPLLLIEPEASVEEAAKAMRKHRVKRLPVITKDDHLIGIVSEVDIIRIFPAVIDLVEEKAALL